MFRNMKHAMNIPASTRVHRLQSRTGKLSEHDRELLNLFINRMLPYLHTETNNFGCIKFIFCLQITTFSNKMITFVVFP